MDAEADSSGELELIIKSRRRVKAHGEVFTPRRMVDQMLDLVQFELETAPEFVDKTFLEPSAGDGNFLIAILRRKLRAIDSRFRPELRANESLFALASIYGIEILQDNLAAARAGLLEEFVAFHQRHEVRCGTETDLWQAAHYLIDANVVHGNTLTGLDSTGEAIEFSWWRRIADISGGVQREPFTLSSLRADRVDALDFAIYKTYSACQIDQVHKEVRAVV